MLETTVARLLQTVCQEKTDQEKEYIVFCKVIFDYIVSHPHLSATEKLTWLIIDKAVRRNSQLTCCLSYRSIGEAINVSKDTAYRLVRVLKEQKFLLAALSDDRNQVTYTTNLPVEGRALLDQVLREKKSITLKELLQRCYRAILQIRKKFK